MQLNVQSKHVRTDFVHFYQILRDKHLKHDPWSEEGQERPVDESSFRPLRQQTHTELPFMVAIETAVPITSQSKYDLTIT